MSVAHDAQTKGLTSQELQPLNTWLQAASNTSIFEAHGFLCAVICCPIQITATTWLPALLPNATRDDEAQTFSALLKQLHADIAMQFSHYEVITPLVDDSPVLPFEASKLTSAQREHLAQWCQGFLTGMKQHEDSWHALKTFKDLNLALQVVSDEDVAAKLLGIKGAYRPHSPQVERIVTDMVDGLPILLGITYDQACEIANPPKENKKPKKTDINLLYHFRPGKIRQPSLDNVPEPQAIKH